MRGHRPPPLVSIIIATHNRVDTLPSVAEALQGPVASGSFEVIVIDDGSTEPMQSWISRWPARRGWTFIRTEHQGPARARNRGVRVARAPWIAFLGDDTVPETGWADEMLRKARLDANASDGCAWIGHVRWHSRLRVTPFMDWIHHCGMQFGFDLIEDPDDLPFNYFYTSNILVPRHLLEQQPFDGGFRFAAYEDTELGYRLSRDGLRLRYLPSAAVCHDHPTSIARFAARQWRAGFAAVHFRSLHPELHWFVRLPPQGPPGHHPNTYPRLQLLIARLLEPLPVAMPGLWRAVLEAHFQSGARAAWQSAEPT